MDIVHKLIPFIWSSTSHYIHILGRHPNGEEVVLKITGENSLKSSNLLSTAYSVIIIFRLHPIEILRKIDDWNIVESFKIAKSIAGSYSFRFQKRCKEIENQPYRTIRVKILKESGIYYFDGYIETLEDIKARMNIDTNKYEDEVLLRQMQMNNWSMIVRSINTEPTKSWSAPFFHEDVLLDSRGRME